MDSRERALAEAARLMTGFADRTGLASEGAPQRYLWTDAFAVCTLLALGRATRDARYSQLAERLIDQVHHVLGRHRPDDPRTGWISGLSEREGELHPTRGGLRIGKPLPERSPGESFNERVEWERDGQYFHYLTQWLHALDQASRATRQPRLHQWARELADTAHAAFVRRASGGAELSMVWKMSIDLTRPLVASMGQHDPLDGFIGCTQLRATASLLPSAPKEPDLERACADFAALIDTHGLVTLDPLGLGSLLMGAGRLAQLTRYGSVAGGRLLEALLAAALAAFSHDVQRFTLQQPASRRVAFRELGLAIGLHAIEHMHEQSQRRPLAAAHGARQRAWLEPLLPHVQLASAIESFWLEPRNQHSHTWSEHRDINEVMLATSLVPEGYLRIAEPE